MTAERRRKIERALKRYARSLEPRLEFCDVKLCIAYFLAKGKVAALKFVCHLNGHLFQFGIRIGHDRLPSKKRRLQNQELQKGDSPVDGSAKSQKD